MYIVHTYSLCLQTTVRFIRRFFFRYILNFSCVSLNSYGLWLVFFVAFVCFWVYSFFSWINIFLDNLHLSCVVILMVLSQAWFDPNVLGSSSAALLMCQSWNFENRILCKICYIFIQLLQNSLKLRKKKEFYR